MTHSRLTTILILTTPPTSVHLNLPTVSSLHSQIRSRQPQIELQKPIEGGGAQSGSRILERTQHQHEVSTSTLLKITYPSLTRAKTLSTASGISAVDNVVEEPGVFVKSWVDETDRSCDRIRILYTETIDDTQKAGCLTIYLYHGHDVRC